MDKVEFATWRKISAIGKLHNIIRYMRASPQHRERFISTQLDILQSTEAFMFRQNNDTRWNSVYLFIQRGIKLYTKISVYSEEHKNELGEDFLLSSIGRSEVGSTGNTVE